MKNRKFTFVIGFVLCMMLINTAGFSYSDYDDEDKIEPLYIAMLFHRLSGNKPDFDAWIDADPEYQNAPRLKRMEIQKKLYSEFNEQYRLMNPKDPITIKFKTKISKYSTNNQGFFIDSLQPNLFFNYEYMGEAFAIIPRNIENYQWFSVPMSDIEDAELDLRVENDIILRMTLIPEHADATSTVPMGTKKYWMILTKVMDIELWSANDTQLLWRGESKAENGKLLDLYR